MMTSKREVGIGLIKKELIVTSARSSGPGGQNVNKVESKVIVRFNVRKSQVLTDEEKIIIQGFYSNQITNDGDIITSCETHRSQLKNKELAFKKMDRLLKIPFIKPKARKKTKPSKSAIQKRLSEKKMNAKKKQQRQKPEQKTAPISWDGPLLTMKN